MRNFPSAFSYFLIFHEFNEAEKQERQQRLRKLAIELLSTLKEEYGQEEESISSKSLFSSSNSSMRADSVA
jgi:S-methylmethionine-dependent homocysteine/selenocysteine methylase